MAEPTLFDEMAAFPARVTDPETSQTSAARYATDDVRKLRTGTAKHRMLVCFVEPLTALQAATACAAFLGTPGSIMAVETHRKRAAELHAAGYITDTTERRRNVGSPDESIVWVITDAGRAALRELSARS